MTEVIYRETTEADLAFVASRMRTADRLEVYRATGRGAHQALMGSVEDSSQAFTVVIDGEPVAVFGFAFQGGIAAEIWMLGTDALRKHPRTVLVEGRRIVDAWGDYFALQHNYVDVHNKTAIRWLKMLGFRFDERPVMRNGHPFLYFWRHGNV